MAPRATEWTTMLRDFLRSGLSFVVTLFLIPALVAASWFAFFLFHDDIRAWWHRAPFDSSRWQAARGADHTDYRRQGMVDDVLRRGMLIGKSKREVLELLGPADQEELGDHLEMTYFLGSRGMSLQWLAIDFGADGTVRQAYIHRD